MKRIITCSDGTWNEPGTKDKGKTAKTNVEKIYLALSDKDNKGIEQLKFYHTGVGTSGNNAERVEAGITGEGLNQDIIDAYKFIVINYEIGDELYLFGFSRGAYTARSLGGLIRNCGILKPQNIHLVEEAFEMYRNRNDYTSPNSDLMKGFKKEYCVEPITPIHCIAIWDTVGSLGIPPFTFKLRALNQAKYKFHDTVLSSYVKHAFHAVAIDEKRKLFKPTLWKQNQDGINNNQDFKQCWFIGAHSNIGGGYANHGLSDITLNWMLENVKKIGLAFESKRPIIKPNNYAIIRRPHLEPKYLFFWLPIRRFIKLKNFKPKIHSTVIARMKFDKNYKPKNIINLMKHIDINTIIE